MLYILRKLTMLNFHFIYSVPAWQSRITEIEITLELYYFEIHKSSF